MAIERRVTELAGRAGGRLHTARSRNDQVATDMAMFVREATLSAEASGAGAGRDADRTGRAPPRLADARLHPPAAGPAGVPQSPPARLRVDAAARPPSASAVCCTGPRRCRLAPERWPASTSTPTATRSPRALGFAGGRRELDRRRLEPRLRARLPGCSRHLRHPPVAAGGRDRAVVQRGVRVLRGLGRLGVRLVDHAPEEESRRRRAAARQGSPGRLASRRLCTAFCTGCR